MSEQPDLTRAFMTGSDQTTEWMLPWMLDNYQKHNDTPITIVDFGMTDKMLYQLESRVHSIGRLETKRNVPTWFYKPGAMLNSPYKSTCWPPGAAEPAVGHRGLSQGAP